MKRIVAFIRPNMLNDVICNLHEMEGFPGASISEVKGIGRGMGGHATTSHHEPFHGFPVSVRLETICRDAQVDRITGIIAEHAHTGLPHDGKIFVCPVESALHIRTGERGESVL